MMKQCCRPFPDILSPSGIQFFQLTVPFDQGEFSMRMAWMICSALAT
jgi:hypothetical protein